jgi:hypothetical protein
MDQEKFKKIFDKKPGVIRIQREVTTQELGEKVRLD